MDNDKKIPQAIDAEETVLGAILLEPDAFAEVEHILNDSMFYDQRHAMVYRAIMDLRSKGIAVDIITVTKCLNDRKTLQTIGGAYFITGLTSRLGGSSNIEFHARIVAEMAMKREIIRITDKVFNKAHDASCDVFELFDDLSAVFNTRDSLIRGGRQIKSLADILVAERTDYFLRAKAHEEGRVFGVPTGFTDIDTITSGWHEPDLIVLAARPAMGKTAFVADLCLNAADHTGVALFSVEMSDLQLVQRMVRGDSDVDENRYKHGTLSSDEIRQTEISRGKLEKKKIFIDDTPALSIVDMRSKFRRLASREKIGLVAVDYLQICNSGQKKNNREAEVAEISKGLKAFAKEMKVPVIVLSQLSRAVETRGGDKRPQLSDLRESGQIEQDADIVIFIHRPEYYGELQDESGNSTANKAEIIIAKHRNGATGSVWLDFIARRTKFLDPKKSTQNYSWQVTTIPIKPNENFFNETGHNPFE